MKIIKAIILLLVINITLIACNNEDIKNDDKVNVAVTIIPQETFVKAVSKDLANVIAMIPPGASEANYQPTPKQMSKLSDASIYFSIGVPAEKSNILPKLKSFNENINLVYLDDKVNDIYPDRYFDDDEHNEHDEHDHTGRDPHIWLSPKRVKVIIKTIKEELIKLDPKNRDAYEENAREYISKLDKVDSEIRNTLKDVKKQTFIVYHPSFGYFAEDYELNMLAIEEGGKEATAKRLKYIIDTANRKDIKFIFYQGEFDKGQAETIATEIGGEAIEVHTLAPDYIDNLKRISDSFKRVLQ